MNRHTIDLLGRAVLVGMLCQCGLAAHADDRTDAKIGQAFKKLCQAKWRLAMHDPCTDNWKEHWSLDGLKAKVVNAPEGMTFSAGPKFGNDACHAVMWTRKSFKGDIRIDYQYTKTDKQTRAVTILYVQATGSGKDKYAKDIAQWRELRKVPSMRTYYNHMNTYHISYAAFGVRNADPSNDYIRARRYMPETGKGLRGTGLKPDYARTGLFAQGVAHHVTVIKSRNDLYMHIRNGRAEKLCHWKNESLPPIVEGRVGLRHMYTRSARYKDVRISVLDAARAGTARTKKARDD